MVLIRKNIIVNRCSLNNDNKNNKKKNALSSQQLIWGSESAQSSSLTKFSVIIASDIIYSSIVIDPLWETIRELLEYPDGVFWMAFAKRKVPVTIDFVLRKAREYGFRYELLENYNVVNIADNNHNSDKKDSGSCNSDDGCIIDIRGASDTDNTEAGPVSIVIFKWNIE